MSGDVHIHVRCVLPVHVCMCVYICIYVTLSVSVSVMCVSISLHYGDKSIEMYAWHMCLSRNISVYIYASTYCLGKCPSNERPNANLRSACITFLLLDGGSHLPEVSSRSWKLGLHLWSVLFPSLCP